MSFLNQSTEFVFHKLVLISALLLAGGTAHAAAPTFAKAFNPATIGSGNISTATFTIENNTEGAAVTGLNFIDTLPVGVTVATPALLTSDCDLATLSAVEGSNTISMSGARLSDASVCTVTVNVTSATPGTNINPATILGSSVGDSLSAPTNLIVDETMAGFSKSFAPASVNLGQKSTLTFTIDNTASAAAIVNLDFTDNLPTGMVVASPANASTNCEGTQGTTLTAIPGASVITLDANGLGFAGFEALAAGASCTVAVDVLASGAGSLANTAELLAGLGFPLVTDSVGLAGAVLTVSVNELTFFKSFTDDPVAPGTTATLRFDIINFNRSNPATAIGFSDDLAAMLVNTTVTSVLTDNCGGTPSGVGTGTFSYSGGSVAADGGACAIEISLNIPGAAVEGAYPSITSTISASSGTFSAASETLYVFAAPVISKSFTDDPAVAGGTVTLEYTITNPSPFLAATDISFIEEFPSILPTASAGPTATSCGGAETLTFTPLINVLGNPTIPAKLTLSGASLAAGASCTISITLDVLQTASGGLHSSITDPITATIDGTTRTGNQATDTLLLVGAPSFSKSFTNATVAPGGSVALEFNLRLSASAPGDVSNIAFSDDVATMLAGTTINSVLTDTCGGVPNGVGSGLFGYLGGLLTPGASCTVSILLDVDAAAAPNTYINTSSTITALADDGMTGTHAVTGPATTDSLLVTGLVFSKAFIDDPALPNGTATLRYTIDNTAAPSGQDASGIIFTDSLTDTLSGLIASAIPANDICGLGSSIVGASANKLLIFTGGIVDAGTSCSFDVTLLIPANATDNSYASNTSSLTSTIDGAPVTLPPARDSLTVQSENITLSKSFSNDPLAVGGTGTLEFVLGVLADAPGTVDNISFTDDLDATLSGLTFTNINLGCNGFGASSGSTVSITSISLAPGASCTITVDLAVPANASPGEYLNTTSEVSGNIGGLDVTGPAASDTLTVRAITLTFTKSFGSTGVSGGTVNLSFTIQNEDRFFGVTGLAFSDDLNAALSGLISITSDQADVCGAGSLFSGTSLLSLTNGSLIAGGSCTINVTLRIPATTAGVYLNTSSQLFSSGLVVVGPASASLTVLNTVDNSGNSGNGIYGLGSVNLFWLLTMGLLPLCRKRFNTGKKRH